MKMIGWTWHGTDDDIKYHKHDNEETIKKRLHVYHSQTAPLIDWYKNEKLYAHIKGIGELETITADVCKAIDAAK